MIMSDPVDNTIAAPMHVLVQNKVHVCGMRDVSGMSLQGYTPAKFLQSLVCRVRTYRHPFRGDTRSCGYSYYHICSSEYSTCGYEVKDYRERMERLKKYVEKNELGTVTVAPEVGNTNYLGDHKLIPAILQLHGGATRAWALKKKWITEPKIEKRFHPSWAQSELSIRTIRSQAET